MAFVDQMPTRKIDVPGEPGEWFEVRELSWKELDECRRERDRKFMSRAREMPADLLKMVADIEPSGNGAASGQGQTPEQIEAAAAIETARKENRRLEEVESFDRETLVTKSVTGWSYERHFQASLMGKLDDHTFTWLFESIVALYVGDDAQRKAASAASMSTSSETDLVPTPST